jgi:hypothetical protein
LILSAKCLWGIPDGGSLKAGPDAGEARFFQIDQLPLQMAFPTDRLICEKLKHFLASKNVAVWLRSSLAYDEAK